MSNEFKLDVNIPQKKIEEMAKQVIRELVEVQIQDVMKSIDIEKVIKDKINTLDTRLSKIAKETVKQEIDKLQWEFRGQAKKIAREIVLEEIQKKPLSGNVYLKIDGSNVGTDYDY